MRAEQNELLTRTGPGTPMGELFRRYWLPALLAEELPEADCPPVRVKLLGERLIAFRDTAGRLGLIDEFCAHRGVSLWFGRNEENGLRCSYHGWKYDVTGQCVEIPSEPDNPRLCQRMKLKSYPLVERGGVLWTYMGTPERQPPAPAYEWIDVPESQRHVSKRLQECNYLQAMEGGLDSIHSTFLHRGSVEDDPLLKRDAESAAMIKADPSPAFVPLTSPGGLYICDNTVGWGSENVAAGEGRAEWVAAVREHNGAVFAEEAFVRGRLLRVRIQRTRIRCRQIRLGGNPRSRIRRDWPSRASAPRVGSATC